MDGRREQRLTIRRPAGLDSPDGIRERQQDGRLD
jgi:hypothetical protein